MNIIKNIKLKSTASRYRLLFVIVIFLSFAAPNIALAAEDERLGGFLGAIDTIFSQFVAVPDSAVANA